MRHPTVTIALICSLALTAALWGPPPPHAAADNPPPAAALEPAAPAALEPAAPAALEPAATTPPADVGWPGTVDEFAGAVRAGNWRLVAAFVIAAAMLALRRARDRVAWLRGDRGGAILVLLLALGGTFVISLKGNAPINGQLFLTALAVAWTAVGGYTWIKRLFWPADKAAELEAGAVDGTARRAVA